MMRRGWLVAGVLSAILAGGLGAGGAEAQEESRRLEELREDIEAREARARSLRDEAEGVLGELEAVDRELHEVRRSLRLLRQRRGTAETDLRETRARLTEAEQKRNHIQIDLEKRLVALYKFYTTGGIPAFYSARTFQEILHRREALGRVLRQDEQLFGRYRAAEAACGESRDRAAQLLSEIKRTQAHEVVREERVRKQLVERKNLVALLRTRADRENRAAAELREAALRLEGLLREHRAKRSSGGGLVRGALSVPVPGSVRLGFGSQVDPEFGTETLRNGIEINALPGAPVRAVANGQVLFAGWFRGYGQIVILDHGGDDTSVSGYLEERIVETGAVVKRGDVIGKVGETGSFSGPGLYFEIRQKGTPVNPEGWFAPSEAKGNK